MANALMQSRDFNKQQHEADGHMQQSPEGIQARSAAYQSQHDEVSVQAIEAVSLIGDIVGQALLVPDVLHDLVLTLARNIMPCAPTSVMIDVYSAKKMYSNVATAPTSIVFMSSECRPANAWTLLLMSCFSHAMLQHAMPEKQSLLGMHAFPDMHGLPELPAFTNWTSDV